MENVVTINGVTYEIRTLKHPSRGADACGVCAFNDKALRVCTLNRKIAGDTCVGMAIKRKLSPLRAYFVRVDE